MKPIYSFSLDKRSKIFCSISIGRSDNEFHSGIRWKEIISLWIMDFPILAFRIYDDPHSEDEWKSYSLGICGLSLVCCIQEPVEDSFGM